MEDAATRATASPICAPVPGARAAASDEAPSRQGRDTPPPDCSDGPLFPRFEAALRAPGGPLGPATGRRPKPLQWTFAAAGPGRPRAQGPHRALAAFGIAGLGVLAGLLLGHQLSPTIAEPGAGEPQARAGAASTPGLRGRAALPPAPVVGSGWLPEGVARVQATSMGDAKGVVARWLPSADAPTRAPVTVEYANAVTSGTAGAAHRHDVPAVTLETDAPVAMPASGTAAEVDRALGRALYQLAYHQQQRGEAEAARLSYRRAAARDPDHAATWYNWGLLLERSGAVWAAVDKYVRAIRADRSHRFAWYNLGYLLQTHGEPARAIRVYERAIALGATRALTFYNLGWLEQKAGRHELAAQLYREAIALDPTLALAHYNLGYLLQLEGDLAAAAEAYRAAIAIDPGQARARRSLADLEARLGPRVAMHRS